MNQSFQTLNQNRVPMKPNIHPPPQPSRKLQSRKLIAGFFLGLLLNPAAQAANDTWTGLGNDENLTNALNWVGGVAPVTGDSLFFTGNSQLTPGSGGSFPTNT